MTGKATLVLSRIIEAALILLGVLVVSLDDPWEFVSLGFWDVIAIAYLAIRIRRLRRSHRDDSTEWLARGIGGRWGLTFTIFTSMVGIVAGLGIVISDGDQQLLAKVAGVPAVLFAWGILHFGYAERYAKTFYAADEPPLAFPNTDRPGFVEFAYFSFTLGTTFSVSDVETQTAKIRLQILSHSILAFVYNTATIGIAVSVITG
ncbi:hypothetical protein Ade02nite_09890 [Paractinoplanes deccanensis]|uniref:DUF1345 domain-containing protein n=1 Tax=Paractinoplanes deccanensis TaxID=113561 RepID=A0ABQ3XX79_9ACTN|nr:DUF1345 domain-containing protein [Actinoplanes deccanensis]GID72348.1 hypothetical protein Ade02nite_09890 [Actinoplanes deccanensis]